MHIFRCEEKEIEIMSVSLTLIGIQLSRVIYPIIIVIGILGNSLNIAVLIRPVLYQHACSQYFLALASNNLLFSSVFFIHRLLSNGYQINLNNYSIILCKLITYITTTSSFLSPYFIVCASIDRYCASSTNALLRRFSSIQIAQRIICATIGIFLLLFIHILVLSKLQPERGFICANEANSTYSQVYIIIQVFLFAAVPPCLMTFFGFMTIKNSKRTNVIPLAISRFHRTERQLARMLLIQVAVHILLTLPTSVTYLISAFPNTIRTTSIFSFLSTIFQLLFNISFITSFFSYFLTGRVYRKELKQLIYKALRICRSNRIQPSKNQTTAIPMASSAYQRSAATT